MQQSYKGLPILEGFFLFVGALWLFGALFAGGMAYLGASRVGAVIPASNQTEVGESDQTQ